MLHKELKMEENNKNTQSPEEPIIQLNFDEETKKSHFWLFLSILIILIIVIFGVGYYFLNHKNSQSAIQSLQNTLGITQETTSTEYAKEEEIRRLQEALMQKEKELLNLAQSVEGLNISVQEIQQTNTTNLRYTIKPKKQIIAECFSMQIGKWDIPQGCLLSLATKIGNELEKDKKVVAFEIQGIVDNNPYKGLSPELKQEGLASFRAWNAIREINKKIPNATAFEGPSLQLKDKRGYRIKAYFVE